MPRHRWNTALGAIGRFLLRLGKVSVILDSNERVPSLIAFHIEARSGKQFKGPHSADCLMRDLRPAAGFGYR